MKCVKDKLLLNLNNFNKEKPVTKINKPEEIEGFFGGLGNWFSGSTPTNLPVYPGSLPLENINLLEKKITDRMVTSSSFPPTGDDDGFIDSSNDDILKLTKPYNPNIENKSEEILKKSIPDKILIEEKPKFSLGKCQFFNDKCPDNYSPLGNFSIEGVSSNAILKCGNIKDTVPGTAIAEIQNNSVHDIHITNKGKGYNPDKPPKIIIQGGRGKGATAEAIIDDDGFLKLIKIINPGNGYSDTPNIMIEPPYMNSSCHLCCEN
jgi:hypothetical protein